MRYFYIDGNYYPKNCIWGPRPKEGVIFTQSEWIRLQNHLEQLQKEKDEKEIKFLEIEEKKDKSHKMTSNWDNTLVSIKSLSDQKKVEDIEKYKQSKIDEYNSILERKRQEKEAIINEAKRIIFEDKETTKQLMSGLAHSAVLHERNNQIKFNKKLKSKEIAKKFMLAQKITKDAADYESEREQNKLKDVEKARKFRSILDHQMQELMQKQLEKEMELEKERQDLVNIGNEIATEIRKEREEIKKSKEKLRNVIKEFNESEEKIRNQRMKEEKEEDELNRIFLDVAQRNDEERKAKEERMLREYRATRSKLAELVAKKLPTKTGKEDRQIEAEKAHNEEVERKKREQRKAQKQKLLEELLKFEEEAKKEAERRRIMEREARKWEIVQKYKKQELNEKWCKEEAERIKGIKERVKTDYMAQWIENEEKRAEEKRHDRTAEEEIRRENEEIMKYCDKILEFTKERGRPVFPVMSAIQRVKRQCGIWRPKKPLYYLQSNVPIESIAIYARKKEKTEAS